MPNDARVAEPGLLAIAGEAVCPVFEFFSRNRLLMSIWLNFFGWGILSVVVEVDPFKDVRRVEDVPGTWSCLVGETSFDEAVGLVADDEDGDSSAFTDDSSTFTTPELEISSAPFTSSAFSMLSGTFDGSVVAIYASFDAM